jgi:DMSO reductase anchor subunit
MKPQYPLVFSTLFMRVGVGVSIAHILVAVAGKPCLSNLLVALFAIVVIVFGVLLSMTHLGKPQRFFHAIKKSK